MRLLLDRQFPSFWDAVHRFVVRRLAHSIEPYHPLSMRGDTLALGERGCEDRWGFIESELRRLKASTVLDLGCAEGYFVLKSAQHGCISLGVDADVRRLTLAQELCVLNKCERAGFMYASLTPDLLSTFPAFDVVIFLSVLHHIMYEKGIEYARDIMHKVHQVTRKVLVFDMGQSNEVSNEWASLLPDMGSDPHGWIADFLKSCGFTSVIKAGETDAYKSHIKRAVFLACP